MRGVKNNSDYFESKLQQLLDINWYSFYKFDLNEHSLGPVRAVKLKSKVWNGRCHISYSMVLRIEIRALTLKGFYLAFVEVSYNKF